MTTLLRKAVGEHWMSFKLVV